MEYIILHHSLTKDSGAVSWDAIRKYHTGMGWDDIGYHFGIEQVGDVFEILIGRMQTHSGAHCKQNGMNRKALGVCLVGSFDTAPPQKEQWDKAVSLVESLCLLHGIPVENVKGHRDYAPKSCPGRMFDMSKFRDDVRRLKNGATRKPPSLS